MTTDRDIAIYKICPVDVWESIRAQSVWDGSADDLRDGFIHLSTRDQLAGTIAKHFSGRRDLVLLAIDPDSLGPKLRWEPSRGGALFPHLYAPLPLAAVIRVEPLMPATC